MHSGANITNNGIYVSNATMMAQNVTSSRISNGSFASVSTGGSVTIPMSSASAFMSPRGPSNTEKKSANLSPKSTSYIFASGLFSRFAARRSVQMDNRMGKTGEIFRCPVFISNSGSVVSLKNTASACALTCAFSSAFRLLPMILKRVLIPSRYPSPFILLCTASMKERIGTHLALNISSPSLAASSLLRSAVLWGAVLTRHANTAHRNSPSRKSSSWMRSPAFAVNPVSSFISLSAPWRGVSPVSRRPPGSQTFPSTSLQTTSILSLVATTVA